MEKIDLQPLLTTKKILEKALKEGAGSELEEMGGVQAFEMAYELSWKTLKKVLMSKGVEVYSPKETFRKAAAESLIREFEIWGEKYLETRNLTVHSYEADILAEVWRVLPEFLKDLEYLIAKIQEEINK
ncbi:MAG: nucleotidyltransferase substrate binding protein [Candidatus Moeniiplasma glomeromycotorum]|nr:nucleotidyltransferase substrate binding protein [Candidatus Moeniiplasma glomeromycotorum]MCE8169550.1 nucleotidyltransferase substrate binding protein [Candidatus Moeniiplasma glomeromycotorum]